MTDFIEEKKRALAPSGEFLNPEDFVVGLVVVFRGWERRAVEKGGDAEGSKLFLQLECEDGKTRTLSIGYGSKEFGKALIAAGAWEEKTGPLHKKVKITTQKFEYTKKDGTPGYGYNWSAEIIREEVRGVDPIDDQMAVKDLPF